MKNYIIISCMLIVVHGISDKFQQDTKMKMIDVAAVCVPEVGATEVDIAELMEKKLPSTRAGKCLISCFQKKFGLQQDADGKPNKVGTMALLEPLHDDDPEMYNKLIQIALACGPEIDKLPTTDHCDLALELVTCVMREGKVHGLDDPFMLQG